MRLPEINLQELEKIKKENFRARLEFQDKYVKWMKMTDNARWSAAQKAVINRKSTDTVKRSLHSRSAKRAQYSKDSPKN